MTNARTREQDDRPTFLGHCKEWWRVNATRTERLVVLVSAVLTPVLLVIDLATRGGW